MFTLCVCNLGNAVLDINVLIATSLIFWEEAVAEYEKNNATPLGRIIRNRELPILKRAKEIIDKMDKM